MRVQHTKGPWVIRSDDESNPYSALSVYGNEPAGFVCVCQTSGNCGPNARLIASAPELLAALEALAHSVFENCCEDDFGNMPGLKVKAQRAIDAIAKATMTDPSTAGLVESGFSAPALAHAAPG